VELVADKYEWITYADAIAEAHQIGAALRNQGVAAKGAIALLAETSVWWTLSALGVLGEVRCFTL
jgi:long-subunit acyl-CoA synthetase (AMP-forming)